MPIETQPHSIPFDNNSDLGLNLGKERCNSHSIFDISVSNLFLSFINSNYNGAENKNDEKSEDTSCCSACLVALPQALVLCAQIICALASWMPQWCFFLILYNDEKTLNTFVFFCSLTKLRFLFTIHKERNVSNYSFRLHNLWSSY